MKTEIEKIRKEFNDKLDALINPTFKNGDVIKYGKTIIKITDFDAGLGYGLWGNEWNSIRKWSFKSNPKLWTLATEKKWLDVLTKEAVKRGLVKGCTVLIDNVKMYLNNHNDYGIDSCDNNKLLLCNNPIMQYGIWAEVIEVNKTLDELREDFIFDTKFNTSYDHMKANPEAYIKALQNYEKNEK